MRDGMSEFRASDVPQPPPPPDPPDHGDRSIEDPGGGPAADWLQEYDPIGNLDPPEPPGGSEQSPTQAAAEGSIEALGEREWQAGADAEHDPLAHLASEPVEAGEPNPTREPEQTELAEHVESPEQTTGADRGRPVEERGRVPETVDSGDDPAVQIDADQSTGAGDELTGPAEQAESAPADASGSTERETTDAGERRYPDSWQRFNPAHHREFDAALNDLRGNANLEPTPGLRGGEGQLFLGPDSTHALKRWYESRQGDMATSIERLQAAKQAVDDSPALAHDMSVVDVGRRGSDWVERGFDPDSVPLKHAVGDPQVADARQRCIDALAGSTDPIEREILRKLQRNSANLHWSPTSEKILIIDMQ
jgi:hypothetical protein